MERGDWDISVDYGTDDPDLEREMIALFRSKTMDEWIGLLGNANVPLVPGFTIGEAVHSEHAKTRDMVSEYAHLGFGNMRQVTFPVRIPGAKFDTVKPAPSVGEHNEEILERLGYSSPQVADLKGKDVI